MKPTKQIVYLPVNTDEPLLIVQQYEKEIIESLVEEKEGYFFTTDELNQLLLEVIKDTLNTAAEKAKTKQEVAHFMEGSYMEVIINKKSITNTFEEVYQRFSVK